MWSLFHDARKSIANIRGSASIQPSVLYRTRDSGFCHYVFPISLNIQLSHAWKVNVYYVLSSVS